MRSRLHLGSQPLKPVKEDEQDARYYHLADEHLCLDQTGVRWMCSYLEHQAKTGSPDADTTYLSRLRVFCSKLVRP